MLFDAAVHRRDKDRRRVELMASEFRHEAAAGAIPQTPADQLFDRGTVVGFVPFFADGRRIAVILGLAVLDVVELAALDKDVVGELRFLLIDLLLKSFEFALRLNFFAREALRFVDDFEGLLIVGEGVDFFNARLGLNDIRLHGIRLGVPFHVFGHQGALLDVDRFRAFWKGHLPAVGTGKVAAVPLRANIVNIADRGGVDEGGCVIVKDIVVTLMADREVLMILLSGENHLFAVGDGVRHQFFGEDVKALVHRLDCGGSVQEERKTDDDRFDAERLQIVVVVEKFVIVVVDFNVLTRFRFGFPTVFLHKAATYGGGAGAVAIAVESAVLVIGANIRNRDDLDIFRVDRAQEDGTFVSRAKDGDADRTINNAVLEIIGSDTLSGSEFRARRLLKEFAARQIASDRGKKVFLTDRFLFAR